MFGLSLAWVTSENSTMLLESDILRLFFTGPYLVSSPLCSVSGVDCPSVLPRQLLLPASLLSCDQLPTASAACLSLGRVVNSHSPPRTTSGYGEIFLSKKPLSGFAPKQTRLLWRPTPIVLHGDNASLEICFSGPSFQRSFSLLLSIPLSRFSRVFR